MEEGVTVVDVVGRIRLERDGVWGPSTVYGPPDWVLPRAGGSCGSPLDSGKSLMLQGQAGDPLTHPALLRNKLVGKTGTWCHHSCALIIQMLRPCPKLCISLTPMCFSESGGGV